MDIALAELDPELLKWIDDKSYRRDAKFEEADGICFLCPKCFVENGKSDIGVHSVICWKPHVPQTTFPVPGRWNFQGTGIADLTLVAGSSSIALQGGCAWHGFIRNGICTNA